MERKKIVIKKYENRRLYDATHSRYVNLDEIARAIQDGHDVQVIDAATGEDITRLILTLIIVEQAKAPNSVFPLDVLREMVVASGKATQESAMNYMSALTNMYHSMIPHMPQPAMAPLEFLQNMMQQAAQRGQAQTPPPAPESATQAASAPSNSSQVSELKKRIDELEQIVSRIAPVKPSRKTTKRQPRKK